MSGEDSYPRLADITSVSTMRIRVAGSHAACGYVGVTLIRSCVHIYAVVVGSKLTPQISTFVNFPVTHQLYARTSNGGL